MQTYLKNGYIVSMDQQDTVFDGGGVLVEDDRITAVGKVDPRLVKPNAEVIDLQGKYVLPGFVNTHVHTSQQISRGVGDDVDTLSALFRETKTGPGDYDLIVTGDLGALGHAIVTDLFRRDGVDLSRNYQDCGMLLYDLEKQDMHAGGSGCGCSAAVLNGYLLDGLRRGRWRRLVFAPTGALLSPTSSFQGESVPGICHAVVFSAGKEGET